MRSFSPLRRVPWRLLLATVLVVVAPGVAPEVTPPASVAITVHVNAPRESSLGRLANLVRLPLSDTLGRPVELRYGVDAIIGEPLGGAIAGTGGPGRLIATEASPLITGQLLGRGAEFRPLRDFYWLAAVARYPSAIVVRASSPLRSLDEWLDAAKKEGRELRYAGAFAGSMSVLAGRLLAAKSGVTMVHEGYADPPAAYAALRDERVDLVIDGLPAALEKAASGDFRIIGVTSARRVSPLPHVRAFGELWPGEDYTDLVLIGVAAGERSDVRAALQRAWNDARHRPLLVQAFADMGASNLALSPGSALDMLEDEFLRHAALLARFPPRR
jgi:tripartite-type tricarboxylate transporter receptor subunit TctC